MSLPVDTSRTWMVNPRIRLETLLTVPVIAISAPARRAMSTSHPPHLCSGAAFSVSAASPDRSTNSYPPSRAASWRNSWVTRSSRCASSTRGPRSSPSMLTSISSNAKDRRLRPRRRGNGRRKHRARAPRGKSEVSTCHLLDRRLRFHRVTSGELDSDNCRRMLHSQIDVVVSTVIRQRRIAAGAHVCKKAPSISLHRRSARGMSLRCALLAAALAGNVAFAAAAPNQPTPRSSSTGDGPAYRDRARARVARCAAAPLASRCAAGG